MRLVSLSLAVCLAAPAASGQAGAPVLTLDQAIEIALRENRDLGLASREVDKAAEKIGAAKSYRYPQVGLTFLNPNFLDDVQLRLGPLGWLGLPNHFAFAAATASQPISQLYDVSLGVKASELSRDAAAERLRGARQLVVNQIKRAYYGSLRAQSGLKPSREALELFRELERVVASLVDERAALQSDLLEVQARRAQQEHDVIVLEDVLATARERLNVALGRDSETPFEFEPIPTTMPTEADLAEARARVLQQRPDVREGRIMLELAKTDARLKKAEWWPRVSAQFTYVRSIEFPLVPPNIAALTFVASWEPFNWGRRSKEIAVKQLAVNQAETALSQLGATATVELNEKWRALRQARALAVATEIGERAAQEKLRIALDRHKESIVLTKDLLQAQVTLADANQKYQAALLGYWEARADFEKAVAEDR